MQLISRESARESGRESSSKPISRTSSREHRSRKVISIPEIKKAETKTDHQSRRASESKDKRRSKPAPPESSSDTDYREVSKSKAPPPLGNAFIKNTLAQMRRTMSTEEPDTERDEKYSLAKRSISYEPRAMKKKAEKKRPEKKPDVIETKKRDEEIFAEKLKARMKASGDTDQETNFKPRTDYQPEKTVPKKRSDTRRLSVGDVKPKVVDRPESRSAKETPKKVIKVPSSQPVKTQPKKEEPKKVVKKDPPKEEPKKLEPAKPDPKVVYQNPDDPFGKKEVFVPPPRKAGSVKDMAKMFGSNVGLENTNNSHLVDGANHGIPNTGNTCYMGQCSYHFHSFLFKQIFHSPQYL